MLKDTIKLHKTMIWCTFHGRLAGVTSVYMLGDTYSTKDLNSLSSPERSATQPTTPIPGDLGCEEDNQDSRSYAQLLSHHIKKNITLIYHITLITLLKKNKKTIICFSRIGRINHFSLHVWVCACTLKCTCMYTYACVCLCVCVCESVCMCIYVCVYVCVLCL